MKKSMIARLTLQRGYETDRQRPRLEYAGIGAMVGKIFDDHVQWIAAHAMPFFDLRVPTASDMRMASTAIAAAT